MLCAVKRSRTVIVSILLLLIIIVFLNFESNEESTLTVKEPLSKSAKPILIETTEAYDYEEIPIIPSWGEFKPTDVRYEKDIFFLETRG